MGRAEVGSTKWISNQQKSKGLGRLRWYCQVCERQMRDENGFKMHVQSESHVRQMLVVGEDARRAIDDFSARFNSDFLRQLRTAHGTKAVHINHFYQEYIADRQHIHMNATRWSSLTEYAKFLGREGICRVDETDKGLHIAWIDSSPDALQRAKAIRRKEMQDKGDEERELRLIRDQQQRAEKAAADRKRDKKQVNEEEKEKEEGQEKVGKDNEATEKSKQMLQQPRDGDKIRLSLGVPKQDGKDGQREETRSEKSRPPAPAPAPADEEAGRSTEPPKPEVAKPAGFSFGPKTPQAKNVFAQARKKALAGGAKKTIKIEQPKKMSEAERIMREELERKRAWQSSGIGGISKKPRLG